MNELERLPMPLQVFLTKTLAKSVRAASLPEEIGLRGFLLPPSTDFSLSGKNKFSGASQKADGL